VLRHPAYQAIRGADFYLILKALQDVQTLAECHCANGFANLRGGTPNYALLIPGVRGFERRSGVAKTNVKADHKNECERASQQNFSSQERTPRGWEMPNVLRQVGRRSSARGSAGIEVVSRNTVIGWIAPAANVNSTTFAAASMRRSRCGSVVRTFSRFLLSDTIPSGNCFDSIIGGRHGSIGKT
jgi:hypothetical protein